MGYLTGAAPQSVDSAVCLNERLTLLYLHKQTRNPLLQSGRKTKTERKGKTNQKTAYSNSLFTWRKHAWLPLHTYAAVFMSGTNENDRNQHFKMAGAIKSQI